MKTHQSLYQALPFYILILYRYWVIVGNSGTPFRKVSAIYCNDYYYYFIHLTDFILINFYWVSMLKFISSTKNNNNTEKEPFGIPGESTEHENNLRFNPIFESKIVSVENRPALF